MKPFTALLAGLGSVLLVGMLGAQAPGNPNGGQSNAFFAGPGTHGATLNGASLLPGTAILGGETVTTGPGGVAILAPTHGAGGVLELTANASATVRTGAVLGSLGSDQLQMKTGDALVHGSVSVMTLQGQTFKPDTANTSYIVNAGSRQSNMGVLTGAVTTYNPKSAAQVIPAGDAVQVASTGDGTVHFNNIKFSQVTAPAANGAVAQTVPASQSQ